MLSESERAAIETVRAAQIPVDQETRKPVRQQTCSSEEYWDALHDVADIALREHSPDFDVADELREAREIIDDLIGNNPDNGVRPSVQRGRAFLARTSRHDQPSTVVEGRH